MSPFSLLTQFKDLQGQGEEAGAGGVGVVLAGGRAHVVRGRQEQQEGHLLPKLQHLLVVDAEVLRLGHTHTQPGKGLRGAR